MSYSIIPLPVKGQLPPGLNFLANPISSYFNAKPPYNNVILEALIFTPPPRPPRILLLQRVGGGADPNAFSNYWQVPSGKPRLDDLTLLHALARVVREQTGLTISYVATMSGSEEIPGTRQNGNTLCMRMLFMVEVSELFLKSKRAPEPPETLALSDESTYEHSETSVEQGLDLAHAEVTIDPDKHRLYVWSTEEDLTEFVNAGLYPVDEKTQYQIMLEAFAFYRQDFAKLESLRQIRQNAVFSQGWGP